MNQTHIHLLITHLPIFGSILGALVLLHGIGVKSDQTKIAAYYVFILSAIGATVAYLTGEGAEEVVEKIQGVLEESIKIHEDSATATLITLIILGLTSIIGVYLTFKKSIYTTVTAFIILFIAFLSFILVARTGYLGGKIRHSEVNDLVVLNTTENSKEEDKEY
jgi:uncharacterized membrane protein